MWLPEMCPSAYTVAITIVPNASEIMPRSAMVNGALPLTISVAGTEPTPTKTRNAVPITSASSFCVIDDSSMRCHSLPLWGIGGAVTWPGVRYHDCFDYHSIMSNVLQEITPM